MSVIMKKKKTILKRIAQVRSQNSTIKDGSDTETLNGMSWKTRKKPPSGARSEATLATEALPENDSVKHAMALGQVFVMKDVDFLAMLSVCGEYSVTLESLADMLLEDDPVKWRDEIDDINHCLYSGKTKIKKLEERL